MPIYHLSLKPISRSAGRTSTAAAAYRSASRIVDERTGEEFDFRRKQGVVHSEIVFPPGCNWQPERSELWNAAEAAEKRKDACVSREHEAALPKEMSDAQRLALVQEYAADLARRHGCVIDFAIHAPRPGAQQGEENWHAHVMCTTRKASTEGFAEKCEREKAGRNRKEDLKEERRRWEEICNQHLSAAGIDQQIDCRSLADQGVLDRPASQHLGPAAAAVDRKLNKEKSDGKRNFKNPANPETRRRHPPPSARGRLLPLSKCDVIPLPRGGGALLLPDYIFSRLEQRRAQHDSELRQPEARRSADLKKDKKEEQQSRAAARQAEADRAAEASARLRRRLAQEPARVWGGEGKESKYLNNLAGLRSETRAGRTVWRFSKTNIAAVVDHGDSLSVTKLSDSRVGAAIQIARLKGWQSLVLTGSNEFKEKAVRAALEVGLRIENEELQSLVRQIEKERQQQAEATQVQQPTSQEVEIAVPPLPATPVALGRRAAELDYLLADQAQAAERLRSLTDYAQYTNKHAQISTALLEARSRQREGVKDNSWLREVFTVHVADKLAKQLELARKQRKDAEVTLAKLRNENVLRRFLSSGEQKRLAVQAEAAKKAAAEIGGKIKKIEVACAAMKDPKTRSAYRTWAINKMTDQNQYVEQLEKRVAEIEAARQVLERRAGLDTEVARRFKEEREQIANRVQTLSSLDRERFERARSGQWQSQDEAPPPAPKPKPKPARGLGM